jgi:NADH-quinone oxidoreductase subunit N
MNWGLALPEVVLACLGMAILIFGVLYKPNSAPLATMFTIGALLVTGFLVWTGPSGIGFGGQFTSDAFSTFNNELILLGGAVALILSLDWNRAMGIDRFEYPVLVLFATVGMMIMVSASNLMTLYLGLELMSLALYVLAAFARDDVRSSEAGLKYFVLSGLASGLLLYGISLVYGFSGTMDFRALHDTLTSPSAASSPGLIVGLVFVMVGLAFKISAVPFHMWTPDVYEGAPTPVTVFFATGPKVAAMALLLRVMGVSFAELLPQWQMLVVVMSIGSMVLGTLAAIGQRSIKRLMAYSSIGHMGYALIGLAVGSSDGVRGVLIYMTIYVLMTAGMFGCIMSMKRDGKPVEQIADLSGLGSTDPALAMAIAVFMFSLAGIPLMAGFFAKLYIFLAAVKAGLYVLAVIGVLTSALGAFYYIRVVKVMYFDEPGEAFDRRPPALSFIVAATGLFTAFFFLFPAPVVDAAEMASRVLFR